MSGLTGLWPRGGLWRHRDFLNLWGAETVSQFGSQVTLLALPLAAILVLDASAFEVAVLGTVEFLPFLLFSLPAGVWVDRLARKPILVWADIGRAVVLASVPAAYLADALTIWQLYAVAFVAGTLTVFFDVAYMSYLPSLVEPEELVDGNAKLEISRSGAQLAGPAVAGGLVEIFRAPLAIFIDAVSFVASALFLFRIKREERVEAPSRESRLGMRKELAEGLRFIFRNPYIRSIAASTAVFNFFSNVWGAVLLVFAVRELELEPGLIGVILAIGNVGAIAGALASSRLPRAIGLGRAIVVGAMMGAGGLLIPLATPSTAAPLFVASFAILGFGVVVYNTSGISLMQAITPDRLLGRMNASRRFIVWGAIPLGALVGGAIAAATDLRTAIWVGTIGNSLAFLPVLLSPIRSLERVPVPVESTTAADAAVP
jgi:MFS family permease